jgi:Zn-finger nucleic acid-binding protein
MSERRIEIRCPECGAPLSPAAAKSAVVCAQCGTTSEPAAKGPEKIVQTVVVERVVVRDAAGGVPAATPCPRCAVGLFAVRTKDVMVSGCGVCGGIWLDNAGTVAITKRVDPQISSLAARAEMNAPMRGSPGTQPIDCPICQKQMKRVNAAQLADLDVCAEHGTWFDPGELRRVMSAYHSKHDDPFASVAGTRDATEARLAHVAAASAPPPEPWSFAGPGTGSTGGSSVTDGGLDILGGLLDALVKKK